MKLFRTPVEDRQIRFVLATDAERASAKLSEMDVDIEAEDLIEVDHFHITLMAVQDEDDEDEIWWDVEFDEDYEYELKELIENADEEEG